MHNLKKAIHAASFLIAVAVLSAAYSPFASAAPGVPSSITITLDDAALPLGSNVTGHVSAWDDQNPPKEVLRAPLNGVSGAGTAVRIKVQIEDDAHSTTVDAGSDFTISTNAALALAAGYHDVVASDATPGGAMPSASKPVALVGVDRIVWRRPADTTYQEANTLGPILKGTKVVFKAIMTPTGVQLPNQPVWGEGGAGTGETAEVTFNDPSANLNALKSVTATCGTSSKSISAVIYELILKTTPADDFVNRSQERFGIGEKVYITTESQPAGVDYSVQLSIPVGRAYPFDGNPSFIVTDPTPMTIGIRATINTGPSSGEHRDVSRTVVAPDIQTHMKQVIFPAPDESVAHDVNTWSAGFIGDIYLSPKDVSFKYLGFAEGGGTSVATNWLAPLNGVEHPYVADDNGRPLATSVGPGDAVNGCKVALGDNVGAKRLPSAPPAAPYGVGTSTLSWPIDWYYAYTYPINGVMVFSKFMVGTMSMTADANGKATVTKAGSATVSANAAAPTTAPPGWPGFP